MSKKIYTFLTYPESSKDLELATDMSALGWAWIHSPVHDRDVLKDGSPKKPHVHWLVGFESNPPKPLDFLNFVRKYGAVGAPQELLVKDPWGAVDYLTHKNNPDKAPYDVENLVISDGWDLSRFTTQEQRNEHRRREKQKNKQDSLAVIGQIISNIGVRDDQISCFADLVKYGYQNGCLEIVMERSYFFNTYISSVTAREVIRTKETAEIDDLRHQIVALQIENSDLKDQLESALNSQKYWYETATGESAPPAYERI